MDEFVLPTGRVKWFNTQKGFGFIESPAIDRDVFFHFTTIKGALPAEGDIVQFAMTYTAKGIQASLVKVML